MNYPYIYNSPHQSPFRNKLMLILIAIMILLVIFYAKTKARAEETYLSIAQSQIGFGETEGDNQGIYIRQYLNGKENLPWCTGFVSYCIKKAGIKLPYILKATDYLKYGKKISNPKAGDLIIFYRKGGGHIGIIEKVEGNKITTIEGNIGKYPSKVKRIIYEEEPKNLLAYIRLIDNKKILAQQK